MNDLEVSHTYLILVFIASVFLPVLTLTKDNTCLKNPLKPSFIDLIITKEFEKWHAIRASVGGVGGVLACVACLRGWHASVGVVVGVLAWVAC